MSYILTVEEAAVRLAELVSELQPGDEITLMSREKPVAKIVPEKLPIRRQAGACKGMMTIICEDDSHLDTTVAVASLPPLITSDTAWKAQMRKLLLSEPGEVHVEAYPRNPMRDPWSDA